MSGGHAGLVAGAVGVVACGGTGGDFEVVAADGSVEGRGITAGGVAGIHFEADRQVVEVMLALALVVFGSLSTEAAGGERVLSRGGAVRGMKNTRSYEWESTGEALAELRKLSGLDFLRKMIAGELTAPPVTAALGFRLAEVEAGRAVFVLQPEEYQYNPIGTVHGGVLATVCDSAIGCAIHSQLAAGVGYTTLELKTNFVRPLTKGSGEARCVGEVLYLGSRQATGEAKIFNGEGKLVAHATATCLIL